MRYELEKFFSVQTSKIFCIVDGYLGNWLCMNHKKRNPNRYLSSSWDF